MFLFAQIVSVPPIITTVGNRLQPRRNLIVAGEKLPELSIHSCLESMGIFLLNEWDLLAFMHRHRTSLTSAQQIADLVGYDSTEVEAALDRLVREGFIDRSRTSQGVRFYRILILVDAERRRCLQQLVSLSESRSGRLLLTKRLKAARSESGDENNRESGYDRARFV